jgi:predicted transcriptional regulator
MDEERLKEAFEKVKYEMNLLKNEMLFLKNELESLKKDFSNRNHDLFIVLNNLNQEIVGLNDILKKLAERDLYINSNTSTADLQYSNTYSPKFDGIKPYLMSSNGNEGVPTNPQQTNTQSNTSPADDFMNKFQHIPKSEPPRISIKGLVASMKTELKAKFKALTKQEFYVFSVIFSLEQELDKPLSYKDIAIKANLTESTIRDYIGRLIARGIPIIKERVNNKEILIRVSEDLRNLASLDSLSRIKSD